MIFGIDDNGAIAGSDYLNSIDSQNDLKKYIAEQTTGHMSYVDIYTKFVNNNRILLFEIPPAQFGIPTAFKGFAYERQGESMVPLSENNRMNIMSESIPDWSGQIVPHVGLEILDPKAIALAKDYYIRNRPSKKDECNSWSDREFLNKVKLTIDGKVTYAAVILVGKEESEHFIPSANLKMRWILRDNDHNTIDSEFFSIPFIASIEAICSKIRNLKYEYFRLDTITPDRMDTYEPAMLREALNNCIAHQDYHMCEYITVAEYDRNKLTFSNAGSFIPGSIENVLYMNSPASRYRNRRLAEAMSNLGMVDVAGGGIIRMFKYQRARFFPMPEYDLSGNHVSVTLTGKVIDRKFADILMKNPDFSLKDVVLLDKVQKKKQLSEAEAYSLRKRGLIEGRKPNYMLSTLLAQKSEDRILKGKAIKNKGFNDEYYRDLIVKYIEEYGSASKKDLVELLMEKLPDVMTDTQKYNKVGNLIAQMKRMGIMDNTGTTRYPKYIILKNETN